MTAFDDLDPVDVARGRALYEVQAWGRRKEVLWAVAALTAAVGVVVVFVLAVQREFAVALGVLVGTSIQVYLLAVVGHLCAAMSKRPAG